MLILLSDKSSSIIYFKKSTVYSNNFMFITFFLIHLNTLQGGRGKRIIKSKGEDTENLYKFFLILLSNIAKDRSLDDLRIPQRYPISFQLASFWFI